MDYRIKQQIRRVVLEHGRLGMTDFQDGDDLYALGLTSHAGVAVMLGIEASFDLEFPDRLLKRHVFESVDAIARAVHELLENHPVQAGAA
jgi:acyl carrier protein